jgi:glycosyltransferase involved in cell wall biosynthesis
MKNKKLLTICIPTYNRPEKIGSMLKYLSKTNGIEFANILVLDNHSEIPVIEIYESLNFNLKNIKIFRNNLNIGGNANIMKCIEFAESEWIWLLGDDDIPLENSLEIINHDIQTEILSNTVILKYSDESGRIDHPMCFDNYKSFFNFITNNAYYNNLLFMSTSVINKKLFCKYYAEAIDNGLCLCTVYPLFILLYEHKASAYLSDKIICKHGDLESKYAWFWGIVYQNQLQQFLSIPFITDKNVRTIGWKWLFHGNINFLLSIFVIMSINGVRKEFIRKTLSNYYKYLYSPVQRIVLLPIYLFLWFILPHGGIIDSIIKHHKNYEKIKCIKMNNNLYEL